jgi:response regulator RpfG family c-di-GMP phosphodiesterase
MPPKGNAMPPIKILVVEDESLVAKDIHNMLLGRGYEVVGVLSTGEAALESVSASRPDLVLMDIVLKGDIDGIAAARTIWETHGVPVVYLTAYADETTLARAKVTEPFGYILKPFDERELQTTIEMAFFKAKMDRALREREMRLRKTLAATIQAMAMTIEMRDPYTAGHQRRVGKLSSAIATRMSLPADQIDGIRMAADIHDVGKIYVPAEILSKPGQLTEIESSIIRTHPRVGYDILKTIEFPWPIAAIVHQHHERIDGSGYPNGLSGEAILLEARIVCVADVVEAMSSHRPYRPAHGIEMALDEISRGRGRIYDPQAVDACLALFRQDGFSLS